MKTKDILVVMLAPVPVLLIPLIGMQVSKEWKWNVGSFVVAWVIMASAVLAYKFVTRRNGSVAYRLATGLAVLAGFVLTWMNLAVGIIGSEDNPANLMYGGVLLVGIVGAFIARFEARGMALALFATAFAQLLVPVIALVVRRSDFSPGVGPVFGLNAFFAMVFAGSALLFLRASKTREVSL